MLFNWGWERGYLLVGERSLLPSRGSDDESLRSPPWQPVLRIAQRLVLVPPISNRLIPITRISRVFVTASRFYQQLKYIKILSPLQKRCSLFTLMNFEMCYSFWINNKSSERVSLASHLKGGLVYESRGINSSEHLKVPDPRPDRLLGEESLRMRKHIGMILAHSA